MAGVNSVARSVTPVENAGIVQAADEYTISTAPVLHTHM
ncbi:hypothetical protein FTUN_3557 [Frigoriglobus tundricola]|uniref:Uncharacterized protein n=1 Tax=Frigoriglobus tundricola TaxID=2774151 RepID=A0A6M5YRT5_9BACT|nr:hypothetical protein FTUN_3557 [Frigoriglobus tundricola]